MTKCLTILALTSALITTGAQASGNCPQPTAELDKWCDSWGTSTKPKSVTTVSVEVKKAPPLIPIPPLSIPPAEFDRYYTGQLTIVTSPTIEDLWLHCPGVSSSAIGCAHQSDAKCKIVILDDKFIRATGSTTGHVLRHEMAHCNGWPSHHPGLRLKEEMVNGK